MTIKYFAIIFIIILVLCLVKLNFVYSAFKPGLYFFNLISNKVYHFTKLALQINKLNSENNNLFYENQKLLAENIQLKQAKQENDFLRKQLNIQNQPKLNLLLSRIISTGEIVIVDNNLENKPVISAGNILIGKTVKHGQIRLITDKQSKIPIFVQGKDITGIAKGKYGLHLVIELIPLEKNIQLGDMVLTSGTEHRFPPSLLLGKIVKIEKDNETSTQKAIIKPAFSPKNLAKVFIITDY